jgi:hypothetical protein
MSGVVDHPTEGGDAALPGSGFGSGTRSYVSPGHRYTIKPGPCDESAGPPG